MIVLHIDYEGGSRCDLIREGAHKYAMHPSTFMICMGWAFYDNPPYIWHPGLAGMDPLPFPKAVLEHFLAGKPRSVHCHNAQFERLITWYVLWPWLIEHGYIPEGTPVPPASMFYCTAAQARARAYPGDLDGLGRALKLDTQKDARGKELIKLLCIPHLDNTMLSRSSAGTFLHEVDPERARPLLEEMHDYCRQDVVVEREAEKCTPPLTDKEFDDYLISEEINDRGLMVDVEFAAAAQHYAKAETEAIGEELADLTGGEIDSPRQFQRIKKWLDPYWDSEADSETPEYQLYRCCVRYKTNRETGETTKRMSLDKSARYNILALEEEMPGTFAPEVLDLVNLTDEAGRTSVSKYAAMCQRAGPGDRVRGAYMFAGASQTTRFSSKGLQVHNFTRDCLGENAHAVVRGTVIEGGLLENVLENLAQSLRPSIMAAPGHTLVWGDFASIEARALPWLSGDPRAQPLLDMFEAGEDVYIAEAEKIYRKKVEKDDPERQIGKVAILSLGYQGGVAAFQGMARNYRVKVSVAEAERIKEAWRASNPWAVDFWEALITAATRAVKDPGVDYPVGRVVYHFSEAWDVLWCHLPGGHVLSYPQPRIEVKDTKFGTRRVLTALKAEWRPAAGEETWPRVQLYGGILANNITQGFCGCLLREVLFELDDMDWPVCGHTHDECLLEVEDDEVDAASEALLWAMTEGMRQLGYTAGLPIAAEVKTGKRYRK